MATEEGGKGEAQRQPLPYPATTTEMYLAAIYEEMTLCHERIRQCDERLAQLLEPMKSKLEGVGVLHDDGGTEISLAPTRQAARKKRK